MARLTGMSGIRHSYARRAPFGLGRCGAGRLSTDGEFSTGLRTLPHRRLLRSVLHAAAAPRADPRLEPHPRIGHAGAGPEHDDRVEVELLNLRRDAYQLRHSQHDVAQGAL